MKMSPTDDPQAIAEWLQAQAVAVWELEPSDDLAKAAQRLAEAMAAVAKAPVPGDIDPLSR